MMLNFIENSLFNKIAAVLLLLLVCLISYSFFTNLYLDPLIELNDEITINKKKAAKVDSILANEKELKEKISNQKKLLDKYKIFLKNSKPATASSELQNKIKNLIVSYSKAKILTIKPFPLIKHEGYSETSIEIKLRKIKHEGLYKILYQIENNTPLLLITEIDIKKAQLRYKTLIKKQSAPVELDVTFMVSGFFRGELI